QVRAARRAADEAPIWRRRNLTRSALALAERVGPLQARLTDLRNAATPAIAQLDQAGGRVRDAERDVAAARLIECLDQLTRGTPSRSLERDHGIEL
ncbi:MAG: hypothetical protein M3445_01085, partial [Actinomycetota bacterium]|nr:hypothetical protein [Actinomycetota bacterium]